MGLCDDDTATPAPTSAKPPTIDQDALSVVEFGWGFAFLPPPGWVRRVDTDRAMVLPVDNATENVNMFMKALDHVPTIEDFAARSIESLRSRLPGCSLSGRLHRSLAGVDAYQVDYAATDRGERLRGRQVFVVHGNVAITATYVAREAKFDEHLDAYDAILDTFQLIAP